MCLQDEATTSAPSMSRGVYKEPTKDIRQCWLSSKTWKVGLGTGRYVSGSTFLPQSLYSHQVFLHPEFLFTLWDIEWSRSIEAVVRTHLLSSDQTLIFSISFLIWLSLKSTFKGPYFFRIKKKKLLFSQWRFQRRAKSFPRGIKKSEVQHCSNQQNYFFFSLNNGLQVRLFNNRTQ